MFHFFGFLFIIIIAVLVIGLSIVGTVIRSVFGLGGRRSSNSNPSGNGSYQSGRGYSFNGSQRSNSAQSKEATPEEKEDNSKHKKLFDKDEGEYVDFEEIKN